MQASRYAQISLDRPLDGVLVARLDRPDKLNALTFEMFDSITSLCRDLEGDHSVRVLVLTGAGRGFCAGLDLAEARRLPAMAAPELFERQERFAAAAIALHKLTTPVIAAINGPAAGAGLSLALACDLRLLASDASLSAAFIRIGLTGGDMGSSWLLPRIVGLGIAEELLLTGRRVDADEALRIGLVNRIVARDDLLEASFEIAGAIMANSPFGVRLTKQVVQSNLGSATLAQAIDLENHNQVLALGTRDMTEALDAFLEKRAPRFTRD